MPRLYNIILIGIFLVLKRYSLIADTLAHVSLAGIAIGVLTGISPVITALGSTILASLGVERLRMSKTMYGESALALFMSGSLALAVILLSLAHGFNSNLFNYLFGSIVTVKQSDTTLVYSKTVYCLIGNGTLALADSAENGFTRWSAGGTPATWQVVTNAYHSSSHSFADNASNAYGNNANNWMVLTNPINTSTNPIVYLTYWQMYSTEAGYDYCYLETSNDNGTTWVTVQSWNGANTTWTQQAFDLTSYAAGSTQFKIRFRLQSDAGVTGQGWHVDDIKLYTYCQDIINSVGNIEQTPTKYSLEQNYPNPFNPVTRINYSIAKQGPVKIAVYDILGREVTVLVNEVKTPGFYSVDFNSTGLSSGMYFYKMESGAFTDTKKLMLIK